MASLVALAILLLYCYIGTMASESVANMADCLYEIDWHKFPIKLQKYMVLMIQNARRPLYFRGYGMITLNLETFREVSFSTDLFLQFIEMKSNHCIVYGSLSFQLIRYSYSYFMIFVTLTTK